MSQSNYILNLLDIEDKNIKLNEKGNNNFIKVIKRIAFGFRLFHRFKARIMICKNLLHMKRANAI